MGKKSVAQKAPEIKEEFQESEMKTVSSQLREARERSKLSIDDVAAQLRISKFRIRQLEDDGAPLMCDVYTRGFIRNYADFLGLASEPLLTQHEALCAMKQANVPASDVLQMTKSSSPSKMSLIFSSVLTCAVVGAIFYTYQSNIDVVPTLAEQASLVGMPHQWLKSTEPVWVEVKTLQGEQLSNHIMEANETYPLPDNEDVVLSTDNLGALQLVSSDMDVRSLGAPGESVHHLKISNVTEDVRQ